MASHLIHAIAEQYLEHVAANSDQLLSAEAHRLALFNIAMTESANNTASAGPATSAPVAMTDDAADTGKVAFLHNTSGWLVATRSVLTCPA